MNEKDELLLKRLSIWCTKQYRLGTIFYYSGNNLNYKWIIKFIHRGDTSENHKIYL